MVSPGRKRLHANFPHSVATNRLPRVVTDGGKFRGITLQFPQLRKKVKKNSHNLIDSNM